jgi:hypothetical protein
MAMSFVDLANEALDFLGASPIQSLSDTSAEARVTARALPRIFDRVLRSYPWNSAIIRLTLSAVTGALAETGEDALAHVFEVPDDVLRVLDVWPEDCAWRVETRQDSAGLWHRVIRADVAGSIRIRAVRRPADPSRLDPLLSGLISAELAVALAAKLTENTSRMATLMDFAARLRREAIAADAMESGGEEIVTLGPVGGLGGRF